MNSIPLPQENPQYTKVFHVEQVFGETHRMVRAYIDHTYALGYHAHSFYEINFILSGSGAHYMGEKSLAAEPGDVFVIPPYNRHAYYGKELKIYNLLLNPTFLEKYSENLRGLPYFRTLFEIEPFLRDRELLFPHLRLTKEEMQNQKERLDELAKIDQRSEYTSLIAACSTMIIIAELTKAYADRRQAGDGEENDDLFRHSVHRMFAEQTNMTVDSLAKEAGMSRSAFIQKFKKITNMSPHRFILHRKLRRAVSMLALTDLTITAIGEELGFYDTAHFIKIFSSVLGYSPGEYRKTLRSIRIKEERMRFLETIDRTLPDFPTI